MVAEGMDLVVVGTKNRDRLAMDQSGRATFGFQLLQPADRLPFPAEALATHGPTLGLRGFAGPHLV